MAGRYMLQVKFTTRGYRSTEGHAHRVWLVGNIGPHLSLTVVHQQSPAQQDREETGVQPTALTCIAGEQTRLRSP